MMNKLRRTLSFRKKNKSLKDEANEWMEDERKVREGVCSFHVKYLGCIEVLDGTGLRICEEAMRQLSQNAKKSERLSFRRKHKRPCPVLAVLHISGDSLRVVEHNSTWEKIPILHRDESQGLIVDQAVEKVSFCAPDRQRLKGFSYICRDSTTRRWMCHGFVTLKETGDRLSHAIGCAFGVCLERKQEREKELVEAMYNPERTSFVRQGSFKQASLTERMADPQSIKLTEPSPNSSTVTPPVLSESSHVHRPRPALDLIPRQTSLTDFPKLSSKTSAFKRGASLRLDELPSTLKRQAEDAGVADTPTAKETGDTVCDSGWDPITALCQQLTQGLSSTTNVTNDSNDGTKFSVTQSGVSTVKMECLPASDLEPTQMLSSNILPMPLDNPNYSNPFGTPNLPLSSTNPFYSDHPASNLEFVMNI